MSSKLIPDNSVEYSARYVQHDTRFYEKQVPRGYAWDTTYAFRLATARAKDRARNALIRAVKLEQMRLKDEQMSTLRANYLTSNDDLGSFAAQAKENVQARSIDGVAGAPDDAIKL